MRKFIRRAKALEYLLASGINPPSKPPIRTIFGAASEADKHDSHSPLLTRYDGCSLEFKVTRYLCWVFGATWYNLLLPSLPLLLSDG